MKAFREVEQGFEEARLEYEPQAFSKQSHQFWTLQIGGWLGYTLFVFFAIIQPQFHAPGFNLPAQAINLMIETLSGFMLSYFQWRLIQKIVHFPIRTTLFWSFFSASVLGLVFNVIKLSAYKVIVYNQRWNEAWDMLEFGGWLLFSLATMFVWTSIFFIMLYNTKLQKEHEELLQAQNVAKDAQLQMLRYQLNPHFMFNTMNAISTLIYKHENETANDMLDKLCEFFRISLVNDAKSEASVEKELYLLELYLSIEKVRFGEKLIFVTDIDKNALKARLPSMLLQPLVENSIKYAVEPNKNPSQISLSIRKEQQKLVIDVNDQGPGVVVREQYGTGIGLKNTEARLDAMFAGDYELVFTPSVEDGCKLTITIPFITKVN